MGYPHYSNECHEYHDVVVDYGGVNEFGFRPFAERPARPEIVCLCGSTRFYDTFRAENLRLTLEGKIVLSIGCDTKSDRDLEESQIDFTPELKVELDELHKRKIDLADRVHVLDVDGYIGESTASEIAYAIAHRKPITYLRGKRA